MQDYLNEHTFFYDGATFVLKEKSKGLYDLYSSGLPYYENLHSGTDIVSLNINDAGEAAIKEIKELNKVNKIKDLKSINGAAMTIKAPYPVRLDTSIIAKLQALRLERKMITNSFINDAIIEKLERDGY